MRSPNWREEELKLALELYLSKDLNWLSKISDRTPEVQALSHLLNQLDFVENPKPEKFRSYGSIRMKLSNFKALDERYGKSSLANVGSADKNIWNQYHDKYEVLQNECREIINQHFQGNKDGELKNYLTRYSAKKESTETSDFFTFANNTYYLVEEFRKVALAENDLQMSQKIVNTCFEIMKALEWCKDLKEAKKMNVKVETPVIKEHGGVNQAPVNSTANKVGKHVQDTMVELIADGFITESVLNELMSSQWSREVFHLRYPFVIKVDTKKDLKVQLRDENGYLRYWKHIYIINDKEYCVCKEWFESGRKYFDAWVAGVKKKCSLGVSEENLIGLLDYIRTVDRKSVSIKRDDIYQKMGNIKSKEQVLKNLIEMGLLTGFQGTERELVVDDYDLLFDMLEHPEKYN